MGETLGHLVKYSASSNIISSSVEVFDIILSVFIVGIVGEEDLLEFSSSILF